MAVIQTPHGRVIGLIVETDIFTPEPKAEAKEESLFADEPKEPRRPGRPKKT